MIEKKEPFPARSYVRSAESRHSRGFWFVFGFRDNGIFSPDDACVVDDPEVRIFRSDRDTFSGLIECLIVLASSGFSIDRYGRCGIEGNDKVMLVVHEGVEVSSVKGGDLTFKRGA